MNANENKNLIIALILMLAVWLGFSVLFPPQQPADRGETPPAQEDQAGYEKGQQAPVAQTTAKPDPEPAPPLTVDARHDIKDIRVETDLYRAVFTSSGGRLRALELKNYRASAKGDAPPVEMIVSGPLRYATLRTSGTEGLGLPADAQYQVNISEDIEITGNNQKELIFSTTLSNGLTVTKSFLLKGDDYTLDCVVQLANTSSAPLRGNFDFALVREWDESQEGDRYSFTGPATLVNGQFKEVDVDDLQEQPVTYGNEADWTSFQTKYFLSVVVPGEKALERIRLVGEPDAVENIVQSPYLEVGAGESARLDYFLFLGPKDHQLLEKAGHQLDQAIDFGFFDFLAKPLLYVLTFFYGFLKNYGLAIILLTVLIKILFWPLTHKATHP